MIELYVIKLQDKWLRSNTIRDMFDGCWADDLKDARIYRKLSQARAAISTYVNKHVNPVGLLIPDIVILNVTIGNTIDEKARVLKQNQQKIDREYKKQVRYQKHKLEMALKEFENAKQRLEEAQSRN